MLQGICSQKEANTGFYLIQHFLQGLIFILLLAHGFMNLYGSLKYLGRHLVMAESVLCTAIFRNQCPLILQFSFTHPSYSMSFPLRYLKAT